MEEVDDTESEAASEGLEERQPVLTNRMPSLDFARLAQRGEELPLHQQHKLQRPPQQHLYRGPTGPPIQTGRKVRKAQKLRLARLSHLDDGTKAKVSRSVQTASVKSWLHTHGYVVKADKLHPAVTRVIAEWFSLVDDDNSKTLEHRELLAALKAAHVPCDDATIKEMIHLMDMNKDGVIDWDEFEVFMTEEFAAGKSLLSGEYILPSGLSLNFGVMISKLKRNKLLGDIKDNRRRHKWAAIASNPDALYRELATMQEAAEATSLTLEHITRSESDGLGIPTPRTQLTAALLRAGTDARLSPTRLEEPGQSLKEKLRATAMGLDVTQQSMFYDTPNPFTASSRLMLDPAATPLAAAHQVPGEPSFYMTGIPDPAAQPQTQQPPLTSYVSEGFPAFPSSLSALAHGATSRSATPGIGVRGPANRAPGAVSPAFGGGPVRLVASQQSNYNTASRPPTATAPKAPQRPVGSASAAASSALGYGMRGTGTSALHSEGSRDPTAAGLIPVGRRMRKTDEAYRSSGSPSSSPTAARPRVESDGSDPRPYGPSRSGVNPADIVAATRHSTIMEGYPHYPGNPPEEPHYVVAHTVASRQHQQSSSRTISQVGMMAQELRAAAGRVPLEPSPSGLPVTALAGVSRSSNGYLGVDLGGRDVGAADANAAAIARGLGLASPRMSPLRLPSTSVGRTASMPRNGTAAPGAAAAGSVLVNRPLTSHAIPAPHGHANLTPSSQPDPVEAPKFLDGAFAATAAVAEAERPPPQSLTPQRAPKQLPRPALEAVFSDPPVSPRGQAGDPGQPGAQSDSSSAPAFPQPDTDPGIKSPRVQSASPRQDLAKVARGQPAAGITGSQQDEHTSPAASSKPATTNIHAGPSGSTGPERPQTRAPPSIMRALSGSTASGVLHAGGQQLRASGARTQDFYSRRPPTCLRSGSVSEGHAGGESPLGAMGSAADTNHGLRPGSQAQRSGSGVGVTPRPSAVSGARLRQEATGLSVPGAMYHRVPSSTRSLLVSAVSQTPRGPVLHSGLGASPDGHRPFTSVSAPVSINGGGSSSGSGDGSYRRRSGNAVPAGAETAAAFKREGDAAGGGVSRPPSRPVGAMRGTLVPPPHEGRPMSRSRGPHTSGGDSMEESPGGHTDVTNPSWSAAAASMLQLRLSKQLQDQ